MIWSVCDTVMQSQIHSIVMKNKQLAVSLLENAVPVAKTGLTGQSSVDITWYHLAVVEDLA